MSSIPELYSFGWSCFARAFLTRSFQFCESKYISSYSVTFNKLFGELVCYITTRRSQIDHKDSMYLVSILKDGCNKAAINCHSHCNVDVTVVCEALSIPAASIDNRVLHKSHGCSLRQQHCHCHSLWLNLSKSNKSNSNQEAG